ncbi:UNVERIFIED_CONTAM: CLIP-associating protein 1 [Gekko kuhli]
MEYCLAQVLQKDVGKRLQVGQELIDYFSDKQKSADLEHDQTMLDKMVDGLATSWVNSSNYKEVSDDLGVCSVVPDFVLL